MRLNPEELKDSKLNQETLESAVNQVKLNGYVVLENVLPVKLVDEMNSAFIKTLEEAMKSNPDATEMNTREFRKNRVRMDLPFEEPFIDPQVISNPFVLQIIERIIGEDSRCFYFSVDAAMPGSDYQTVHGDYVPFFPDSSITLPASGIVVNFPLVDVTEENGPMEAWPGGSHLTPENLFTSANITAAASQIKPTRMLMSKGSILIRDVRMWHRGTPNNSNEIRPNIAVIYGRKWWDGAFYPQDSIGITREKYDALSIQAQRLFRFEKLKD